MEEVECPDCAEWRLIVEWGPITVPYGRPVEFGGLPGHQGSVTLNIPWSVCKGCGLRFYDRDAYGMIRAAVAKSMKELDL